ncbi:Pentatricopeptide repeat-containing protein At5g27460 [Linum perenne]
MIGEECDSNGCNLDSAKLESAARFVSSVSFGSYVTGRRNTKIKDEDSKLRFTQGESPATNLKKWTDEGRRIAVPELKRGYRELLRAERYLDALEILEWMGVHSKSQMSVMDYANGLELTIMLRGTSKAEEYFERLPNFASRRAAFLLLLSTYVKQRNTIKAEAFMVKLNELGLILDAHPFNEMMKLYMATSDYEKVHLVVEQMKQNQIPRNVLSYNLWMCACGETFEVEKAEMVYTEMVDDQGVEVGWSSLCSLANVYSKAGLVDKSLMATRNAEKKLSPFKRRGYFFLMTIYSSLKNKEGVLRVWKASKEAKGIITCADYMCVLSCLVKLGAIVEAERVFMEWESSCRNYDIRVPNVLLGAYVRSGMMNKAESLHLHAMEKGGNPNYKTWEIMMEGWVKTGNMDKAVSAMKRGLSRLKDCHWRPSETILMAIAELFEKQGNLEDANNFLRIIHHLGISSLPLYKLLLRFHHSASKPAFHIIDMMNKDKIEMDGETSALVQALHKWM